MRPAGTVGGEEAWLRSTFPAAPSADASVPRRAADQSATGTAGTPADAVGGAASARSHEPAVPGRSLDDSDLGWGDRADDSNDERLRQNRPPHW